MDARVEVTHRILTAKLSHNAHLVAKEVEVLWALSGEELNGDLTPDLTSLYGVVHRAKAPMTKRADELILTFKDHTDMKIITRSLCLRFTQHDPLRVLRAHLTLTRERARVLADRAERALKHKTHTLKGVS